MNILKMGTKLPDDAEEVLGDDGNQHYRSKSRQTKYSVDPSVGKYPENPDDPHHGKEPAPPWFEGDEATAGYHPWASADFDVHDFDSERGSPKSQMHQQLAAPAESGRGQERSGPAPIVDFKGYLNSDMEQMMAAILAEQSRRSEKKNR